MNQCASRRIGNKRSEIGVIEQLDNWLTLALAGMQVPGLDNWLIEGFDDASAFV
jgi:hypothetical protein